MLDLSYHNLNELPDISDTVTHLDISYNNISRLDKLPPNLVYLNCSFNDLSKLPKLPKSLTYLNISHNKFSSKPRINKDIELFDHNNPYNIAVPDSNSNCFDFNLGEFDNLDFYLTSSKDNLVIKFKNKYICYNRRDLKFININNNLYEFEDPLFNGLRINKKNKNLLKSRYYSLYNVVEEEDISEVIPYRRNEYLTS